jgi:hypothetical protein
MGKLACVHESPHGFRVREARNQSSAGIVQEARGGPVLALPHSFLVRPPVRPSRFDIVGAPEQFSGVGSKDGKGKLFGEPLAAGQASGNWPSRADRANSRQQDQTNQNDFGLRSSHVVISGEKVGTRKLAFLGGHSRPSNHQGIIPEMRDVIA